MRRRIKGEIYEGEITIFDKPVKCAVLCEDGKEPVRYIKAEDVAAMTVEMSVSTTN